MSVTIFTMTHKKFKEPSDSIYVPLQVGRACGANLGYPGDDTGDNISAKNCYYGELTGVYWVWKNVRTKSPVGICHYRRYFCTEEGRIFNERDYLSILEKYDIITSKKLKLNYSYFDGHASDYNIFDLITTGEVIRQKYPAYYENFERLVHGNGTYFANMMVAPKVLYDEYCAWLFSIFEEVEKRIDASGYDDYHKRVFGFISEFLLLVWVETKGLKVCECKIGMTTEKYETMRMKEKLADFFRQKDIAGAKAYFLESLEKRPDVLMEASDITGELKLAMQVVAVCELEQAQYGESVIDQIQDFDALMRYFNGLNDVVNACRMDDAVNACRMDDAINSCQPNDAVNACQPDGLQEENIRFLQEERISDIAIEASARMFCTEEAEQRRVAEAVKKFIQPNPPYSVWRAGRETSNPGSKR